MVPGDASASGALACTLMLVPGVLIFVIEVLHVHRALLMDLLPRFDTLFLFFELALYVVFHRLSMSPYYRDWDNANYRNGNSTVLNNVSISISNTGGGPLALPSPFVQPAFFRPFSLLSTAVADSNSTGNSTGNGTVPVAPYPSADWMNRYGDATNTALLAGGAILLILMEARPIWRVAVRLRIALLSLSIAVALSVFVSDVVRHHRDEDDGDYAAAHTVSVCFLQCADTRRVALSSLLQIAVFFARYLIRACQHPYAFTVLNVSVLHHVRVSRAPDEAFRCADLCEACACSCACPCDGPCQCCSPARHRSWSKDARDGSSYEIEV
jgi:hypothetical protein